MEKALSILGDCWEKIYVPHFQQDRWVMGVDRAKFNPSLGGRGGGGIGCGLMAKFTPSVGG